MMLKQKINLNSRLFIGILIIIASCKINSKNTNSGYRIPCKKIWEMDSIFNSSAYIALDFKTKRISLLSTPYCLEEMNSSYETLDSFFTYIDKFDNVKSIQLNNLSIDSFPLSITNLKNINNIHLIDCNIKILNMSKCYSLKDITIKNNKPYRYKNVFESMPKDVEELYFKGIEIDTIDESINKYKKLKYIGLVNCYQINYVSRELFSLDSLKILVIGQTTFPITTDSLHSGFGNKKVTIERY